MARKQVNIRLPQITIDAIEALSAATELTQTEIIIMAVNQMYRDFYKDDSFTLEGSREREILKQIGGSDE